MRCRGVAGRSSRGHAGARQPGRLRLTAWRAAARRDPCLARGSKAGLRERWGSRGRQAASARAAARRALASQEGRRQPSGSCGMRRGERRPGGPSRARRGGGSRAGAAGCGEATGRRRLSGMRRGDEQVAAGRDAAWRREI